MTQLLLALMKSSVTIIIMKRAKIARRMNQIFIELIEIRYNEILLIVDVNKTIIYLNSKIKIIIHPHLIIFAQTPKNVKFVEGLMNNIIAICVRA